MQDEKRVLRALVHHVMLNERGWRDEVLRALVETAFFYAPDYKFTSLEAISNFISAEFRLQFHQIEVSQTVEALSGKSISRTREGWRLVEQRISQISKQVQEDEELERRVKQEWLAQLDSKYPTIGRAIIQPLWVELVDGFVGPLFLRLGAECLHMIGSEVGVPLESYAELLDRSVAKVEDPDIKAIVAVEFPAFFLPVSPDRRHYLMNLLDGALAQYSIGLDRKLLETIHKKPLQFILFLDTNFLYSLCGLNETTHSETARLLISMSRKLRENITIKFYFVDVTQSEYVRTIDATRIMLTGVDWSAGLSRAALQCGELSGLTKAYHTRNASNSIDPEVFFGKYRNPIPLFKNMSVEIYQDKFLELKQDQLVIDDIYSFKKYLESVDAPRQWETMEHDVLLWHIARRKRSALDTFSDAKYFVLTHDYRFTRFDSYKQRQLGYKTPICIFPNHFFQVLRFFIPSSDDFEAGFLQSLRVPLVRAANPEKERITSKILQTLALYSDLPETVACDILTDQALANEVTKVINEQEKIVDLIDKSLGTRLREMETERNSLEAQKEAVTRQRESLESNVSRLQQALQQSTEETKRLLSERDRTISELSTKIEGIVAEEKQRISGKKTRREEQLAVARSCWMFVGLLVFALLAAYFLDRNLTIPPVSTRFYYFVMVAIAMVIWYRLIDRTGLAKTSYWRRWSSRAKKVGITLIALGGLWQGIELILRLVRSP